MEESCEYGLPRGTCFVARRLELVAVAGRLCISWCAWVGRIFFVFFSFLFLGTHTADCKYEATLPHVPLLVMRLFFAFRNKSLFIPGCVQGAII